MYNEWQQGLITAVLKRLDPANRIGVRSDRSDSHDLVQSCANSNKRILCCNYMFFQADMLKLKKQQKQKDVRFVM